MSGIFEDTIIVLASDNGGAPSVGGMNYPFRGQKVLFPNSFNKYIYIHIQEFM
tara:strand:+ start:1503 stop:1661 length:159 start_codon:yes stop_codon:yes gene_type:complete